VPKPKRCWGPEVNQHAPGCRPGRPLCRWARRVRPKRRPCNCGAYHFPHRLGGGLCGHPDRLAKVMWGPPPEDREAVEQREYDLLLATR
jgi:hypothetical protein